MSLDGAPTNAKILSKKMPETDISMRGCAEGWIAPFTIFDAPNGFGDEVWSEDQPDTVIAWVVSGSEVQCEINGFRGRSARASEQRMSLQTRGSQQRYCAPGRLRFGHFYLTDALVDQVVQGLGIHLRPKDLRQDLVFFPDSRLWGLLDIYGQRALDLGSSPTRLEMDARALLVGERLITASHVGRLPDVARGGLAPWQLKRACEAMEAQFDSDIGLDDLAKVAGCSPTHFSRAFKQSTGVAPFHWINQRRIAKAKELLADRRQSLAAIALAVGFSAQPQFTTAFGRATGTTPGRWRRERLS